LIPRQGRCAGVRIMRAGRCRKWPARPSASTSRGTAAPSCSIASLTRSYLATPRRWSVSVSDLPDAAGVAAYRRTGRARRTLDTAELGDWVGRLRQIDGAQRLAE